MICTSRKTAQSYSSRRACHWNTPSANSLGVGYWRASGKTLHVFVADVAEIFDTDFASEESVDGHQSQEKKEINALTKAGIAEGVPAIGYLIKHLFLLLGRAFEKDLAVTLRTG